MEETVRHDWDHPLTETNYMKYAIEIARYMIHGTIISPIFLGIWFSLGFIGPLFLFSDILLPVVVLFLSCFILVLIGIINAYTTDYIWKKETSKHWFSLLCHGFFLALGSLGIWLGSFLIFGIALIAFPIIFEGVTSVIILFVVIIWFVLVSGMYGKNLVDYVTRIDSLLRS
ncbi:MAG: hypothetical protein RTU63_04920 [Candidatus Thorarchaeota archaeon]